MLISDIQFQDKAEYSILYSTSDAHNTGYFLFTEIFSGRSIVLFCFVVHLKINPQSKCALPKVYENVFKNGSSNQIVLRVQSTSPKEIEEPVCKLILKEVYSEKNPNITIRLSDLNSFLYQIAQSLSITESLQNKIDIENLMLMTGSLFVVNFFDWNLVFKVQSLANENQSINYLNVPIKSSSFRFLINYFVLRPNIRKLSSLLSIPENGYMMNSLRDMIRKEAFADESLIFDNAPFLKLFKIASLLRSDSYGKYITNQVILNISNEVGDPDTVVQFVMKRYHKEHLDSVRMINIEACEMKSSENGINLLMISKAKEAAKLNPKAFYIILFSKMNEILEGREEFIRHCSSIFEKTSNVLIIYINSYDPAAKTKNLAKFGNQFWHIEVKLNIKRLKAILKDNTFYFA